MKFQNSRGTKLEKMLTLATERYTAGFCRVAKNKQYFKLRKNIFFLISSLTFKNISGIYNDF